MDSPKNKNDEKTENKETPSSSEEESKEGMIDAFQKFFAAKLSISDSPKKDPVLKSATVEGVVEYLKSGKCKNIITLAGAGISTSAGIPDFRSPESGLYANLSKYNLPHPEAVFDLDYFMKNPQPFFSLAKELYPGEFNPTPSHYFIRLLHEKGLLLRHYTQNIDTLEHVAGIPADLLVEAHGSFKKAHCVLCKKEYSQEWIKDEIFKDNIPTCTEFDCKNLVKPDIVFFKEGLPERFFDLLEEDFPKCDLLIIMGTSLTVQPFASLIENVSMRCPRLLINRDKVGQKDPMMAALAGLFGGDSLNFDSPENDRDVAMLGNCDDVCLELAEKLEWKEDLEALIGSSKSNEDKSK